MSWVHLKIIAALDVAGRRERRAGRTGEVIGEFLARTQEDGAAVVGTGNDETGAAGLEPDGGIAAQAEEQEDRVVGFPRGLSGVDFRLDDLTQARAADVLAELGVLDIDHVW